MSNFEDYQSDEFEEEASGEDDSEEDDSEEEESEEEESEEEEFFSSSSGDSKWESLSDEETEWDSLNLAKFQVGKQWVNQAERIQHQRQAKRYQEIEYPTQLKSIASRKKNAVWEEHRQNQIPNRTTSSTLTVAPSSVFILASCVPVVCSCATNAWKRLKIS